MEKIKTILHVQILNLNVSRVEQVNLFSSEELQLGCMQCIFQNGKQ